MTSNELFGHDALAFRDRVRDVDAAVLSGEDSAALLSDLVSLRNACDAAAARLAARAVECGVHRANGYADGAEWVGRLAGVSPGRARREMEVARQLEQCPETRDAVCSGELSLAQAGVIAATERECPGSEAEMLSSARSESFRLLRERSRKLRERAVDPADLQARRRRARHFRHWVDGLGMVRYSGAALPEDGIPFVNRLDVETKRLGRAAQENPEREPWEAHAADAFAAMVRGEGKPHGVKADVCFVVDLRAARRGWAEEGEVARIAGGPSVPVDVILDLMNFGDPFLKLAAHDGVAVQWVTHFGRHLSAEVRTALDLGPPPDFDGRVCACGCGGRYGLHIDHRNPLHNGGPTQLDNLQPLRGPEHVMKTKRDRANGLC